MKKRKKLEGGEKNIPEKKREKSWNCVFEFIRPGRGEVGKTGELPQGGVVVYRECGHCAAIVLSCCVVLCCVAEVLCCVV